MSEMLTLVERHQINRNNPLYDEIDRLGFLSKNLYNSAMYQVRKHYFDTKEYINFYDVNKLFVRTNQVDYRSLPTKVSKYEQGEG